MSQLIFDKKGPSKGLDNSNKDAKSLGFLKVGHLTFNNILAIISLPVLR